MVLNTAAEFLGTLLNRPLTAATPLRLSSAQRARFNAWLHERGIQVQDQRLSGEFTIAELIGEGAAASAPAPEATSPLPATAASAMLPIEVGLDIQSVAELTDGINLLDLKGDSQMTRLFTASELSYAQARPSPAETVAGLFAAKEAIRKSMGGPAWTPEQFRGIEVLPDEGGRPTFPGFAVSISHSGGMAAAIACRSNDQPDGAHRGATPQPVLSAAQANTPPSRRFEALLIGANLILIVLQLAILLLHRA